MPTFFFPTSLTCVISLCSVSSITIRAAQAMAQSNLWPEGTRVHVLDVGVSAWVAAGYPLASTPSPSPPALPTVSVIPAAQYKAIADGAADAGLCPDCSPALFDVRVLSQYIVSG